MIRPYEHRFPWMLDWNLLRTFLVIVDQQGITRAAELLGVKQPTISSALKRLEETVGVRLIDRNANHFAVTAAGRILYSESSTIFRTVGRVPDLLGGAGTQISGHVTIVLASHVVSPHLDDVLETFNRRHPAVTYSFTVAESAEVVARVQQNDATLGFALVSRRRKGLEYHVLFREFFALYCGPAHRLFGRKRIALSELEGESSVSFQTDSETGPLSAVHQLRERAKLQPELKGVSANLPEVRRLIINNIGIGALPVHVAQREVDAGQLWRLPPYASIPSVDIHMLVNPARNLNAAEEALVADLRSMIAQVPLDQRTYRANAG